MEKFRYLLLMLLLSFGQDILAKISDPPEVGSKYGKRYTEIIEPQLDDFPGKSQLEKNQEFLKRPDLSEEERYLLRRGLIGELWSRNMFNDLEKNCADFVIKPDDYWVQFLCIPANIPTSLKSQKLEAIFEKAVQNHDGSNVASRVGRELLGVLWLENDLASARVVYKKTLDVTPLNANKSIFNLKWSLATIYTLPTNSRSSIEEGLRLFDEIESVERADPDEKSNADVTTYNKGIVKLMSLENFQGALEEFQKLPSDHIEWIDSKIFSALALIRLQKPEEAKNQLKLVDFQNYPSDPTRLPFLKCYRDLVLHELTGTPDLSSCVNLPFDTQAEVVVHVTKELSRQSMVPAIELALWRQFWNFYTKKITPQLQGQNEAQVNAMELARAKADSQIKDLELKNFFILKCLFGLLITLFLGGAIMFWRFHLKNQKILFLQGEALSAQHKVEMQENMMQELEVRSAMAARTSHHINNPLNAISGFRSIVEHSNSRLQTRFESMLPKPAERSPDAIEVARVFADDFAEISDSLRSMKLSLKRVEHVVKELQHISGVNGFKIERIQVRQIWETLQEEFNADDSLSQKKITWTARRVELDQEAFGHESLISRALFYILKEMVEEIVHEPSFAIVLTEDPGSGEDLTLKFMIQNSAPKSINKEDWRELTLSTHIAASFGARLSPLAEDGAGIQIALDKSGVRQKERE